MGNKKEKVKKLFEDKELEETKHYSKRYAATVLSVVSVVFCILSVLGFLWVRSRFSDTEAIKAFVDKHYFVGAVSMVLICAFQVVVALIPGELLEIACGYVFGSVMGAVLCLIGTMTGSVIAILIVRMTVRGEPAAS